jgi:KaiC/GvpD/RAD55 family RecA-like ATPase
LADNVKIQVMNPLLPGGCSFGCIVLIEYEPDSLWYETSLTIASDSIHEGYPVDYHTFQHPPEEVISALSKLDVDTHTALEKKTLRILDSYSPQLGEKKSSEYSFQNLPQQTIAVQDWKAGLKALESQDQALIDRESYRIHIDDNTSALLAANDEKAVNDFFLMGVSASRKWRLVMINALCLGVASDVFYKKWESLADLVLDVRAKETRSGELKHFVRVRTVRGTKIANSSWNRIDIHDNGRVSFSKDHSLLMSSASEKSL